MMRELLLSVFARWQVVALVHNEPSDNRTVMELCFTEWGAGRVVSEYRQICANTPIPMYFIVERV